MNITEKLGKGRFDGEDKLSKFDFYINDSVPSNASPKAKKYEFDQNLKEFLSANEIAAWKIVYVEFNNLSEDLIHKLGFQRLSPNKGNRPFSSFLIKDELFKLFEIADGLIDGWSFSVKYHGAAYKSSATLIVTFSFETVYKDKEGDERRLKREEELKKEAERQKETEKIKRYLDTIKRTYKSLGTQNNWKEDDKRYAIIDKAFKENTVTAYSTGYKNLTLYISDKYKIYWEVDSSD